MKYNNIIKENIPAVLAVLMLLSMAVTRCNHNRTIQQLKNNNGITKKEMAIMFLEAQKNILRLEEDIDNKTKTVEDVMHEIDQQIQLNGK